MQEVAEPHNPAYTRPLLFITQPDMKQPESTNEPFELHGEWWTVPTTADDGQIVIVTGRDDVARWRDNPRYKIRITVTWPYEGNGMPADDIAQQMQHVTEALDAAFYKDPIAVMTGIYTGDGQRDWVFYAASTHIFGRKLNEALAALPLMPLQISAENDPDWAEYAEMKQSYR